MLFAAGVVAWLAKSSGADPANPLVEGIMLDPDILLGDWQGSEHPAKVGG